MTIMTPKVLGGGSKITAGSVPSPLEKILERGRIFGKIFGLEIRILVHSPALLIFNLQAASRTVASGQRMREHPHTIIL